MLQAVKFTDKRVPGLYGGDIDEFKAKCSELRRLATTQELDNPVSFALENCWTVTLKSDKQHFLEHITRRMT